MCTLGLVWASAGAGFAGCWPNRSWMPASGVTLATRHHERLAECC